MPSKIRSASEIFHHQSRSFSRILMEIRKFAQMNYRTS